ncbi:AAA family ATPase [Candidatus Magnetobacterium casense]|uniref:MoxR family ATPase n=1 Tax=Candidatus Magnetobacterium casense TaxID=1455061 RepID=A0ABS6RU48_9BACT|nr:MoxR family ATPase [Candidatus Magnetobacterium casensis]MBV6340106.1 MoxR family ATPase [Candidatus Magnetobacterium casensis]
MDIDNGKINQLIKSLLFYLQGKERALRLSLVAFFSRGHLLIEDLPGLGKTTMAIGIAKSLGLGFGRVQCTSDLLPSDITGLSIYNKNKGEFEFHHGPIFSNIVLVDEINRATPKTQSALLEAMGEKQVTIEEKTYQLSRPFFILATQNPLEQYGTFPLPESQMDRFMLKISIGYPDRESELDILRGGSRRQELYNMKPIIDKEHTLQIQQDIRNNVHVSEKILAYIIDIVEASRTHKYLASGISTRGALAMTATARSHAFISGRDFVIPEDVKDLAQYTIVHRVLFKEDFDAQTRKEIIKSLIEQIPIPV